MPLSPQILELFNANQKKYCKGEIIFGEGYLPYFFFQIKEGAVKVYSINNEGKEFTQGVFEAGESFGEPPLLACKPYPSTAVAMSEVVLYRISKDILFNILDTNPAEAQSLIITLAMRIFDKARNTQILMCTSPEEKIIYFLNKYKESLGKTEPILIPYTRQQIADFVGLRVETVIRTFSKLHTCNKVNIIDHKVFY